LVTTSGEQQNRTCGVQKIMSQPSGKLYVPPFSGVRLIECREHFQLVPVPAMKVMHGYGKIKASKATIDPDDPKAEPIWDDLSPDEDVWVVMEWYQFEDGKQVPGDMCFTRPECTEDQIIKRMEDMKGFSSLTREDLLGLTQCFEAKEEDYQYIEDKQPNYQDEPDPNDTEKYDVYHARLKVMADLQPKTVELIKIYNCTKDPVKRQQLGFELVQSYFAELAHYWTEDEVLAWQRTNPVGTGWMCEFGDVMREPRRTLDPVNHELALNWLRENYNRMTAGVLADSIFKKIWKWLAPGFKMTADFIKKRRERLGLTTKRPPGPPPKQA
jgi:hypothetical protein